MAADPGRNQPRRRPRRRAWLLYATYVILIVLPCLGLASSFVYLGAWRGGLLSRWRPLGTPPDGGVEFVTGDRGVIYVRSAAGTVYGCKHSGWKVAEACWHEAEEPVEVDRRATFDRRSYPQDVEPPAGTVVDALEVTLWRGGEAFETRYVILDDSTVWKWEYDQGAGRSLMILVPGSIVGGTLGVVVLAVLWIRARRRRSTKG